MSFPNAPFKNRSVVLILKKKSVLWYNFLTSNVCLFLHSLQWPLSCLFVSSLYGEEKWTATTLQLLFSSFLEVGFTCWCGQSSFF